MTIIMPVYNWAYWCEDMSIKLFDIRKNIGNVDKVTVYTKCELRILHHYS